MLALASVVVLRRLPAGAAGSLLRAMRQRTPSSPCVFFHRGFCRFGDACRFSHADVTALPGVLPFADRSFAPAQAGEWPAPPPAQHSRVRVMTYNILADHLAHEHAQELYNSSPRYALEWGYRRKLIVHEVEQYLPDVVCLQEVDRFAELRQGLEELGYEGLFTKRTGDRRDGLATFWRRDVFSAAKHDTVLFTRLGLKDNVAQVVVLQRRQPGRASSGGGGFSGQKRGRGRRGELAASASARALQAAAEGGSDEEASEGGGEMPRLAVANIHVLFNPRRGDIKLAQVRTLFETVRRVCREQGGLPAVVCGDFNSAAGSPIYQYISSGQLDLSQHERRRLSGQVEAQGKGWPSLRRAFLQELSAAERAQRAELEDEGEDWGPAAADEDWGDAAADAEVAAVAECGGCELGAVAPQRQQQQPVTVGLGLRPRAAPAVVAAEGAALGSALARFPPYNPLLDPYASITEPPFHIDATHLATPPPAKGAALGTPPGLLGTPSSVASWASSSRSGAGSMLGGSGRPSRGWTPAELQMAMGGPTASPHFQLQQHSHSFMARSVPSAAGGGNGRGAGAPPPHAASAPELSSPGNSSSSSSGGMVTRMPLRVASAYAAATSSEPPFTTCHDKFIGTVDYIWYTPEEAAVPEASAASAGARFAVRPLSVLLPPSLQSLRTGLPAGAWPSDHISLVADFALFDASQRAQQAQQQGEQLDG